MMGVFWSFLLHQSFGKVFPLCHTSVLSLPETLWVHVLALHILGLSYFMFVNLIEGNSNAVKMTCYPL